MKILYRFIVDSLFSRKQTILSIEKIFEVMESLDQFVHQEHPMPMHKVIPNLSFMFILSF